MHTGTCILLSPHCLLLYFPLLASFYFLLSCILSQPGDVSVLIIFPRLFLHCSQTLSVLTKRTEFAVTTKNFHGMVFTGIMIIFPLFSLSLRFAVAFTEELKKEAEVFMV